MENNFQNGFINIMMATTASKDLSSWPKEMNIINLTEIINTNMFISAEDI